MVPNYSLAPAVRAAGSLLHILHVVEDQDWESCSSAQNRAERLGGDLVLPSCVIPRALWPLPLDNNTNTT